MKIAILVQDISTLGGVEIVSIWLAKKLSEKNEVQIVSGEKYSGKTFENSEDLLIEFLNLECENGNLSKEDYQVIEKFFSINSFDLVIFQAGTAIKKLCFLSDTKLCEVISRYSKIYYILHESPKYHLKRYNTAGDKLPKFLLKVLYHKVKYACKVKKFFRDSKKYITQFVTLSNGCKKEMKDCYKLDSIVMYNPYSFDNSETDFNRKKNTVFFAGRLSAEKDVLLILQSWNLIKKADWNLKIAGDGPEKEKLKDFIAKNNIQNVEFLGAMSHDKVIEEMHKSKIFMLCSFFEGFPTVISEALNYKNVPVITKYDGFSDELLNKNNSFLCRRNAKEIAEKLKSLMENKGLLAEFAENGYRNCKEFYKDLADCNYNLENYK